MKIYDDPSDQCLLCVGYNFKDDYPLQRELTLRQYKEGVKQKEWWRYHHSYLGLKTWVAYQGVRPVGHIELMPIEHTPRPIAGKETMVINCLHVDESAQNHGVGRALLAIAEEHAFTHGRGITAIAWQSGEFMPLAFYDHMDYQIVSSRRDEFLVYKPYNGSRPPSLIPIGYQPILVKDRLSIVYFHCPQCPRSGWALKLLKDNLRDLGDKILLQVLETGERKEIERLGIDHRAYINGRPTGSFPLDPELLLNDITLEFTG
jgi:GNAT superfamily N-acetyltransferase